MPFYKSQLHITRGGKQYRVHKQRYFYIKQLGWFVRIRGKLELSEGMELYDNVAGPFVSQAKAKFHLLKLIYEEETEPLNQN